MVLLWQFVLQRSQGRLTSRSRSETTEAPPGRGYSSHNHTAPRLCSNTGCQTLVPCTTLRRAPQVKNLSNLLHPDYWLTSDDVDLACYHLAKEHSKIAGFHNTLLYSNLYQGSIVGTRTYPLTH